MIRQQHSPSFSSRADLIVCLVFAAFGFVAGGVEFWLSEPRTIELASAIF